jgi:formylglycine-generating enzyme required for sulfatase activity
MDNKKFLLLLILGVFALSLLVVGAFIAGIWFNRTQPPGEPGRTTTPGPPSGPLRSPPPMPPQPGMVRIPGGTFMMGCSRNDDKCRNNEKPAHQVTVSAFWMDGTPVTNAQYHKCESSGDCGPLDPRNCNIDRRAFIQGVNNEWVHGRGYEELADSNKGADQPVVCVHWQDAANYCRVAGKRLPTEAEWEFAARGGMAGPRYGDLDAIAWYNDNSGCMTHPVGGKQPNAYGLYDMLGNVEEWCADWYDNDDEREGVTTYYALSPSNNPTGPVKDDRHRFSLQNHVVRGVSNCTTASGHSPGDLVRVSARQGGLFWDVNDWGSSYIGFRCVRR